MIVTTGLVAKPAEALCAAPRPVPGLEALDACCDFGMYSKGEAGREHGYPVDLTNCMDKPCIEGP